jgi:superfamily II DNA/RNA helicase
VRVCRALDFSAVRYFVLDEADEMLNMGFQEDVEYILEDVPPARQTMFFSATMPQWVRKLARKYCRDYTMVDLVGEDNSGAPPPPLAPPALLQRTRGHLFCCVPAACCGHACSCCVLKAMRNITFVAALC